MYSTEQIVIHWIFFTISIISFGILSIPQIILNYKSKKNPLSIHFIYLWIIADTLNGTYCLYNYFNTESYISYVSIILPYFNSVNSIILLIQSIIYENSYKQIIFWIYIFFICFIYIFIFLFNVLWLVAWISFFAYISAPLCQIYKNYCEKSTNGLSKYTFILLIIANISFIISELVINSKIKIYDLIFPIIFKSIVLIFIYIYILFQFRFYR
jgi:hypothetical protein